MSNHKTWLLALSVMIFLAGVVFAQNYTQNVKCSKLNGKPVPPGLTVLSCSTMVNDNFFHSATFMQIDHGSNLSELLTAVNAPKTYEHYMGINDYKSYDAIWFLDSLNKALGIEVEKEEIARGYEIESNRRNNWLLINKNKNISYYIEN